MKFLPFVWRNLTRKKTRTVFTLLSVLTAFLLFGVLMAVRQGFITGARLPGAGLMFTLPTSPGDMPRDYYDKIAQLNGIAAVLPLTGDLFYFRDPKNTLNVSALDPSTLLHMFPKINVPAAQRNAWINDRTGALVRVDDAKRLGLKIGDHVPLIKFDKSGQPGKVLDVTIDAIQGHSKDEFGFGQLYVHYDYYRAWSGKQTIGAIVEQVKDPNQETAIAKTVDAMFANSSAPTRTQPLQALVQNFIARFGDIGTIALAIVAAALIGMLIVTANTMAQSIRERTNELAMLQSLGFSRTRLVLLIFVESLLLTGVGGLIGLGCAWVATTLLGPAAAKVVPGLYFPPQVIASGVVLIVILSLLAAVAPGVRAVRLGIADALRRA